MSDQSLKEIFEDINESIDLVLQRTKTINSYEDFLSSDNGLEKLDAVSMRLQVIGETLKKVEKENKSIFNKHQEVEWQKIIKLRDLISHHYFDLDAEIIFDVIQKHLPVLQKVINKIIIELNKEK